jgi:hypothetical protein
VAKLVDAPASGAGDRKVVGVRVPSWAPNSFQEIQKASFKPFSQGILGALGLSLLRTHNTILGQFPKKQVMGQIKGDSTGNPPPKRNLKFEFFMVIYSPDKVNNQDAI